MMLKTPQPSILCNRQGCDYSDFLLEEAKKKECLVLFSGKHQVLIHVLVNNQWLKQQECAIPFPKNVQSNLLPISSYKGSLGSRKLQQSLCSCG